MHDRLSTRRSISFIVDRTGLSSFHLMKKDNGLCLCWTTPDPQFSRSLLGAFETLTGYISIYIFQSEFKLTGCFCNTFHMKTFADNRLITHVVTEFSTRFNRLINHLFYDVFHRYRDLFFC